VLLLACFVLTVLAARCCRVVCSQHVRSPYHNHSTASHVADYHFVGTDEVSCTWG